VTVAGEDSSALRLFVAMPGTNLGSDAKWKNPEDVRFFFGKVCETLVERLGRKVELIIEKEKRSGGVIHDSMFREAYEADVYIADLTGNNPNVFLELGVRYALRRGVTVIVSQDTKAIPFNVESMRAVQYANRAVEADPLSVKARARFVKELRLGRHYTEALDALREGIALDPTKPIFFQERGLCYGRLDRVGQAVDALREAARLDPDDTDVRSSLGGALRRLAFASAPQKYDRDILVESLGQYDAAYAVDHHDTYAGLNVAKTKLFLSKWDSTLYTEARELFEKLAHLCAFESADAPDDYWRLFDLADTQLFQGKAKAALDTYTAAIDKVSVTQRGDVLRSPLSSLSELAEADVLKGRVKRGAGEIIELLDAEVSSKRAPPTRAEGERG